MVDGMRKAVRDRVWAEFDELSERSLMLYVFMGGESFKILSEKHRELLEQQYNVMAEYGQILRERLDLLGAECESVGVGEGRPVKGDTAKDGGCRACDGTGEVLAEECGVCMENF